MLARFSIERLTGSVLVLYQGPAVWGPFCCWRRASVGRALLAWDANLQTRPLNKLHNQDSGGVQFYS